MIAVPKKFKLGGRTWEVLIVPAKDLPSEEDEIVLGACREVDCQIMLLDSLTPAQLQDVFYHEFTHAVMHTLGWDSINNNESKVDLLGTMFHQFLDTKRGNITSEHKKKLDTRMHPSKR